MGMTLAEKILARASGRERGVAGRDRGRARGPRDEPRERRPGAQELPRNRRGARVGPVEDRHHLRPPRARPNRKRPPPPTRRSASSWRRRASSTSTTWAAAASATRCCPRTATCGRAWWWWAPIRTPPRTARSAPSPPASAPPRWPASGPKARCGSRCRPRCASRWTGEFRPWISAKDLILYIIGKLGAAGADYRAVEFDGPAIRRMSVASRMVLANLSMEMGAKVAFTPVDEMLLDYLRAARLRSRWR